MKICCECKINQDLNQFNKNKNTKDGLNNRCKLCCSNRNKNRYKNKKEYIKDQTLKYYYNNREKILSTSKSKPTYHKSHPEYYKEYRENNNEKLKQYYKKWRQNNKPSYSLRIQVWWWIKKHGISKTKKTEILLGYTFEEFEKQIGKPVTNQHLDHKVPISWFKSNTPINLIFHLENLHYIDSYENRSKSNTFAHPVSEEYKSNIKKYIKTKYKSRLWT